MGFQKDGEKKYVRSKRVTVQRAISWGWTSIIGTATTRLAFVPYSSNNRQQSRWGALDFDAHDGERDRAQQLAFAAFRVLLNQPDLSVVLETSGSGGWHVWAISEGFHDCRQWVRLLKSVVDLIGAVIEAGVCEIFPPDSLGSPFGRGVRAPGSWNPGADTFSEILWENTRTSLDSVLSGKSKTHPLNSKTLHNDFLDKENSILSLASFPLYHWQGQWAEKFAISQPNTRHEKLAAMVGEIFHQVGKEMALGLVTAQFHEKAVATKATEQEHIDSSKSLWAGLEERWRNGLTESERESLAALGTGNQQDAFRIIRSFAIKAEQDGIPDFPIVRDNLAARLGLTGNGASWIREKFVKSGILRRTADCKPNKAAARFKWLLSE
jgi:hypothetical protein